MQKPNIIWIGTPNFTSPKGYKTIAIVDHIMAGTLAGTDSWFNNPTSKVSSHFGVGKNGEIYKPPV
jgi:N-acetyl-anhydromuramyl-L-alanine amidase AmpD